MLTVLIQFENIKYTFINHYEESIENNNNKTPFNNLLTYIQQILGIWHSSGKRRTDSGIYSKY